MKSAKLKQFLGLFLVATVHLSVISGAFAGDKNKKQSLKAVSRPIVTAVSGNSITVGSKTYTINSATEIYVNDTRSTIDAVQTGMEGEVTAGMDRTVASRISVYASNDKADDKKSQDKKKKK